MKAFLTVLVIFTVLFSAAAWFVFERALPAYSFPEYPVIGIFFFVLTAATYYIVIKADPKKPRSFVNRAMGTIVLKLFLSVIILLCYGLFRQQYVVGFFVLYMVGYLAYLALEVVFLYKALSSGKPVE